MKYEVTQAQWIAVMGGNPSSNKYGSDFDIHPVENISWNAVQEFILKVNKITGKKYRLPTEAEWEYAARGGSLSSGFLFSGSDDINEVAWSFENTTYTHCVGTKKPNELGIYDMSGNVFEWCSDWLDFGDYYYSSEKINPKGTTKGFERVIRGGSCRNDFKWCRSTKRYGEYPHSYDSDLGFRLVQSL